MVTLTGGGDKHTAVPEIGTRCISDLNRVQACSVESAELNMVLYHCLLSVKTPPLELLVHY